MAGELILIVEDNPKNLKLIRDVLQYRGYTTLEAETGALRHLGGEYPGRREHVYLYPIGSNSLRLNRSSHACGSA